MIMVPNWNLKILRLHNAIHLWCFLSPKHLLSFIKKEANPIYIHWLGTLLCLHICEDFLMLVFVQALDINCHNSSHMLLAINPSCHMHSLVPFYCMTSTLTSPQANTMLTPGFCLPILRILNSGNKNRTGLKCLIFIPPFHGPLSFTLKLIKRGQ